MPIPNYKQYGEAMGLRWPFTEDEVEQQMKFEAELKRKKMLREINQPKELSGAEFLALGNKYK